MCFNAYATRIQGSGTLCRQQRRWAINKTTRLCIYTSVSWCSAYPRCLLSTITEPRLCTRTHSCASAAAVPTCVAFRRLPVGDVYLHAYSRVNWRSACRHCLLWTTLPSCVPAHILERGCSTLQTLPPVDTGPGCVPARTSGRASTALTGVASHRQAVLDKYMHICLGKLAQPTGVASC